MLAPATRSIVAAMRRAAAAVDPSTATARVELSRAYGRRRYMLAVTDAGAYPLWTSAPVLWDATARTLWVRPPRDETASDRAIAPAADVLASLRALQASAGEPLPGYAATPAHRTYRIGATR